MARVLADPGITGRTRQGVILLGLFGAALFYGDGLITPAISVLSAVEGLDVATPVFAPYIVPITLGILVGLFWIQSHGTTKVGVAFGPITCVWFGALGILGAVQIGASRHSCRAAAPTCAGLPRRRSGSGLSRHGQRLSCPDRGRGALCRHGPLRPAADPPRLVRPGAAGPAAQLLRPGRAAAGRSGDHPQSLLPHGAGLVPAAAGGAGHGGDGDRFAGGDHRRVFDHAAGDPARLCAAHGIAAHLRQPDGADLHARRQLADAARRDRTGAGLQVIDQSGGGLRHRGDRHHDHHHAVRLPRRAPPVGLAPAPGAAGVRRAAGARPDLSRRQFDQDSRRRLVPAGLRRRGVSGADHMEGGAQAAAREARHPGPPAPGNSSSASRPRTPSPCRALRSS
jgi:hypothetical protein